jgi:7-carboxy-7-deazaguanine synthase
VGIPTIFVRFAGCNLRCPGWACDTQHAIDPKLYRKEWLELGAEQIFERIMGERERSGARNICFTGGEPFLQEHDRLLSLITMIRLERNLEMEVFTNGTISWPRNAVHRLNFVMDWKLDGSGEEVTDSDIVWQNMLQLRPKDAIKFTVADKNDLAQATTLYNKLRYQIDLGVQFFVGPVWGKIEPAEVVEWILNNQLPWRLNLQVHKYIWDPEARET